MDFDALQTARIAIAVVVVLAGAFWLDGVRRDRRRRRYLADLARAFGATVVHEGEFLERFQATVADRPFDIRHEYFGTGRSGVGQNGWFLVAATRLPERWGMHTVEVATGALARALGDRTGGTAVMSGDPAFDRRFA